jgi:hypothetical protein
MGMRIEHLAWDLGRWNVALYLVACAMTYFGGGSETLLAG